MSDSQMAPDPTAARVALSRAMHVQLDAPPHVLADEVGIKLLSPADGWQQRPDMHPENTKMFRASIVARARFIEDLVIEEQARGCGQYVLLGAGLDSFAQRRPEIASQLQVFEVDQPGSQAWKRQRLIELGYGMPAWLHFVPVDFETGASWWQQLLAAGFDPDRQTVITSTGVSMYLTHEAIAAMLRQVASLAPGSKFAMTFMLPMDMAGPEERSAREFAERGARANGTPFISFFRPEEMVELARQNGFQDAQYVAASDLGHRYFQGRSDGLQPPISEALLLATT
jgi:methyltransferase (TIGR00027 family)